MTIYFQLDGKYFEYVKVVAIDSPLFPGMAMSYMKHLKFVALLGSRFFFQYVDDIFVIWQQGAEKLQKFLEHLIIKFAM